MENRILHFGYSSNYGGVEAYIRNLNNALDLPIDLAVTSSAPIPYEEEFIKKGGRIHRITPRSKNYFKHYLDLFRLFKRNKDIRLVHVHLNSCSSLAPLKAARLFGKICVAHSHTSKEWSGRITHILHSINKHFLRFVTDYRFACSYEAGRFMFNNLAFEVYNNGIEAEKYVFSPASREKIRNEFCLNDEFVIGHIGLFSYIKNQSFLVDVFNEVNKRLPNSVLMLVGDGADRASVEQKVKDLALEKKVIFTGKRADINELLCAMDVFVLPSVFEGIPLTLIEAQASGIHCIASDSVSKKAKITDLFESVSLEEPAEKWADAVLKYADGYERKNTLQAVIDAGYDVKATAKRLLKFYSEHING
ncbi:MAG: glycosyltransferase family 1 protein [Eubacterium sp.]